MKRLFDICVSGIGLTLSLPVIVFLGILISAGSSGFPIFSQERVGQNEKRFKCYKLRTMYLNSPNLGTHEISLDAITPAGRWIRMTKLDELPQLWNVFRGEMSLVGPRPCLPTQTEVVKARRANNVFEVKPGITGLAQINSLDMSTPEELARCDRHYIDNNSFVSDIKIMFATVFGRRS